MVKKSRMRDTGKCGDGVSRAASPGGSTEEVPSTACASNKPSTQLKPPPQRRNRRCRMKKEWQAPRLRQQVEARS